VTVAEAGEVVTVGDLDPEAVHTPHLYVDHLVRSERGDDA
jgi:acyl CoA:acetate/3-ketoacid CoA transferase alpha subunit